MSDFPAKEHDDTALGERFAALETRIPRGARVLAAVSGGLDSMVLLDLLRRTAPRFGWTLAVAHVDHGLRDDAVRDLDLVRAAAAAGDIPFLFRRVAGLIAGGTGSLETRARRARFHALEEMRIEAEADLIALAHTADDRAETVLLNLLRGTGPRGLGSLRERRGRIVRPLLPFRRSELLSHAKRAGLSWRTDATNWSGNFTRNWIRHHLIPLLERQVNPRVVECLARAGDHMARWSDSVDGSVARALDTHARADGSGITLTGLNGHHDEWTLSRLLAEAHRRVSGGDAELSEAHLRACMKLIGGSEMRRVHLPGSILAEGSHGRVRFSSLEEGLRDDMPPPPAEVTPDGHAVCGDTTVRVSEIDGREALSAARAAGDRRERELFDADAVRPPLRIRPWLAGDRVRPWGLDGTKLVSDVLTDEGVVGDDRRRILVMEDTEGILWVVGLRRSDRAPIGDGTKRALACSAETRNLRSDGPVRPSGASPSTSPWEARPDSEEES